MQRGRWTLPLVYHYQVPLGLSHLGALLVGSKAIVRARATGTEPVGVGEPGDGLLLRGAQHVCDFLNHEVLGIPTA